MVEIADWESAEARDAMMRSEAMGAFAPLFELLAAPFSATVVKQLHQKRVVQQGLPTGHGPGSASSAVPEPVGGRSHSDAHTASSAAVKSASMSRQFSMPTESRTMPSPMPARSSSSVDSSECVVVRG